VLQYNKGLSEQTLCFANAIPNPDGGTHYSGLKARAHQGGEAIHRPATPSCSKTSCPTSKAMTAAKVCICVLSVKLPNPRFNSQTKVKLVNGEVEGVGQLHRL